MLESLEGEVMILSSDLGYDLGSECIRWDRRKDVNENIESLKIQDVGQVVFVL